MCGIAGIISLDNAVASDLGERVASMNAIQEHRGPDGQGIWLHESRKLGFGHRRLSIIDIEGGRQPMLDMGKNCITYNGEIYNYVELRNQLKASPFVSKSDTEVILHAYRKWGPECLQRFRGMFAFALWDEQKDTLFCARDRFGIKPFYYAVVNNVFYFASETKALLPFMPSVATDKEGLQDYLTFQFCLEGKTLFEGIRELQPGHFLTIKNGTISVQRYWEVFYDLDFNHTEKYFCENLRHLLEESVQLHVRSDVEVGAYVSGGLDSSTIAVLASQHLSAQETMGFTGKFAAYGPEFDESQHARTVSQEHGIDLREIDITATDFIENIRRVIYHLDYPVAGPGSFNQFMVSKLASAHRKVVLGGQGGDEIFGGYARYLIAYFEQCIKGAIDGTIDNRNFVVTYESIIPNLVALKNYKPMLAHLWKEGLFDEMDSRYFRLINRAPTLGDEIKWNDLGEYSPFATFSRVFNSDNVRGSSYFDLMSHFDFKTLLPALLQVEDRMSMAHGLESRVPLLDHPLVELSATIPSNIKFENGAMKHIFKRVIEPYLPQQLLDRKDKMGFPIPLIQWMQNDIRDFVYDTMSTEAAKSRSFVDNSRVLNGLENEPKFGRKLWGLLSLELWQQEFHDKVKCFDSRPTGDHDIDLYKPGTLDYKNQSRKAA